MLLLALLLPLSADANEHYSPDLCAELEVSMAEVREYTNLTQKQVSKIINRCYAQASHSDD
jgi:hypothetical protein